MGASTEDGLCLGAVDQVSYVVADLTTSLPHYESLFGPFRVFEARIDRAWFRGEEVDCMLKIALNSRGPVEIELIEVLEGDTPHLEHLRAHGEGLHHVRFRVAELDAKLLELEAAGYRKVFVKRFGPGTAFAYLQAPEAMGGSVIELLEMP